MRRTTSVAAVLALVASCFGYRPVILMHGILSDAASMLPLADHIQKAHPGTKILNIDLYEDLDSVINPMMTQVKGVADKVRPFMAAAPDGVNMIGFSQGAILLRTLLEYMPDHNVRTYIALSGPQGGQYGDTEYLQFLFPDFTKEHIYEIFYTTEGQEYISVANYWKDPHHMEYYEEYDMYLPFFNNASSEHKENFLRLHQLVLVGGPDDGVITPWQSSHFGYYDSKEKIVDVYNQTVYTEDAFGLKTLDQQGKLTIIVKSGIQHLRWTVDEDVFKECIEPWLD